MIDILIYLVILVVVVIFLWWLLQQLPLPPPLDRIVRIVLIAFAVIALILVLLQATGTGPPWRLPRSNERGRPIGRPFHFSDRLTSRDVTARRAARRNRARSMQLRILSRELPRGCRRP